MDNTPVARIDSMNERLATITECHNGKFVNNDLNFKFMNEIPDENLLLLDGLHLSAAGVNRLLQNLSIDKATKCSIADGQRAEKPPSVYNQKNGTVSHKTKISTKSKNGITLFYGKDSMFSNLNMDAPIYVDGIKYNCNEQLYTYTKAKFFGDNAIAEKAMTATDPYELIRLQKEVKNWDRQKWLPVAERTLYLANMAKYTQNAKAREALIKTGNNIIGEATYSKTWGIGSSLHDTRSMEGQW